MGDVSALRDVVPLRDVLAITPVIPSADPVWKPALFEQEIPQNKPDYGAPDALPARRPLRVRLGTGWQLPRRHTARRGEGPRSSPR
jgi:hypothetical protein